MARKVSCDRRKPASAGVLKELGRHYDRLVVFHDEIAFSEKDNCYYCICCGAVVRNKETGR